MFEARLDMIARDIGIDPIELRLKNRMLHNDTTCCGYYAGNLSVGECLEAARDDAKWPEKKGKLPANKGIGVANGSLFRRWGLCIPYRHSAFRRRSAGSR